jgi:hypothetical protein
MSFVSPCIRRSFARVGCALAIVGVLLGVVSCGSAEVRQNLIGPDGRRDWIEIRCKTGRCEEAARKVCERGFQISDRDDRRWFIRCTDGSAAPESAGEGQRHADEPTGP